MKIHHKHTVFLALAVALIAGLMVSARIPSARAAKAIVPNTPGERTLIQITTYANSTFKWFDDARISGNGQKIVFANGEPVCARDNPDCIQRTAIYLANTDGSNITEIVDLTAVSGGDEFASVISGISYDGNIILYGVTTNSSGDALYFYRVTTGENTLVKPCTTPPDGIPLDPICSTYPGITQTFEGDRTTVLSGDGRYIILYSYLFHWNCHPEECAACPGVWLWECSAYNGIFRIPTDTPSELENVDLIYHPKFQNPDADEEDWDVYWLNTDYTGQTIAFRLNADDKRGNLLPESGVNVVPNGLAPIQLSDQVSGLGSRFPRLRLSPDGEWVAYENSALSYAHQHVSGLPLDVFYPPQREGSAWSPDSPIALGEGGTPTLSNESNGNIVECFSGNYFADETGNFTPLTYGNTVLCNPRMDYSARNILVQIVENDVPNLYVLKSPGLPDLTVELPAFSLDDITLINGRYILPLDITLRNTGEIASLDFQVRLSDNGNWSETRDVAALPADGETTIHLDWDLTSLLIANNGQATARLTVTTDPTDALLETSNLNNTASASLDVNVRPQIIAVNPAFKLDGTYFLDRVSLSNRVSVFVDWNGDLPGEGNGQGGAVYFDLNDIPTRVDAEVWGAAYTYDMGADFQNSLVCANNTLRIWVTYPLSGGELFSPEKVFQPTVFPWPDWVEWAITSLPGSDTSFELVPKPPLAQYTYKATYPDTSFKSLWTPAAWVPYLGGNSMGFQVSQAKVSAWAKSDGSGWGKVYGAFDLLLAGTDPPPQGEIWGTANPCFVCGESFDLQKASLGMRFSQPFEYEESLLGVIPNAKKYVKKIKWQGARRAVEWILNIAKVKGTLTPSIATVLYFREQDGELNFSRATGTMAIDARAMLSTEPVPPLSASVYGGGEPYMTFQVPKNPGYFQKVGIQMYYGAEFQMWTFQENYEERVDCSYPGTCLPVEDDDALAPAALPAPMWRLIPRDYAGVDYARPPAQRVLLSTAALQSTATSTTTLLTNIYPRPEPALALRSDGHRLLAYVHDDTSRPQGRGTEIYAFAWNGSAWSGPTRLTDDAQPDFAPALAYDGSGSGVAVWERSALASGITPTLDITFAQSLEIAAATWNGSAWSAPITLTNNGLMDTAPLLSTGSDGTVMALWKTTDGEDILGTPTHPLTLTYALWNGSAWSGPTAVITGLHDVIDVAFAAYSSTQAALVYAVDGDGVLTTTADSDLYYATFDGTAWSTPQVISSDAITDTSPALAYDASGSLHLLWLRNGDLVWLKDSWNVNDARTVRAASTEAGFLGFTLSRAANGNLALLWQGMDEDGADLTYSVYDAGADSWGADNALTTGADVEADHAPAFGNDGNLYAAYRRVETQFVTRTFAISPTASFTVTNLPQAGQSDLMFLAHTVGRDLTFDSLTITPTNPGAGQAVTLTAVLRNAGDLAVVNPQVAFYDGFSQISNTQTLPTLAAGYTTTVQTTWTVPSPTVAHTLKATADPNGQVAETDETNNSITLQTTLPDLRIELLYSDYTTATVTYTVRIANGGVLTAAAPFTVALRAADPLTGTLLGTVPVTDDLAAGAQTTVTLAITDPLALAGLGTQAWAVVDDDDAVPEADEGNNSDYAFLPLLPDLTLTAADISGDGPVTVTLHNSGVLTATAPTLAVWSGGLTGTLLYSTTLSALGPGASADVTLSLSSNVSELWVKADPENLIVESSEGNNLAVQAVTVPVKVYLPLVLR